MILFSHLQNSVIAHELGTWLLHYSPAVLVLYNILPMEYYQHHLLLVERIHLLLKDSLTECDVKPAKTQCMYG